MIEKHKALRIENSDHLTLLNVYNQYKANKFSKEWCDENFIYANVMIKTKTVVEKLQDIVNKNGQTLLTCSNNWNVMRECICKTYFHHAAKHIKNDEYRTLMTGVTCYLASNSTFLFEKPPKYIIFHELIMGDKVRISLSIYIYINIYYYFFVYFSVVTINPLNKVSKLWKFS